MAVDLSRAVGWWEEWQLRILVLGSLFLQFALFAGSMVRNRRIPMPRLCIWLAYLGADALAIYALATLFNRHKLPASAGRSGALEVLWAPVLLIHLGGQHSISAFSIEDNELWRRHIVTVVSQVTVALYVFCKSWPRGGDKRLLQAAIVLFVVGIVKLIQKPWALKTASLGTAMKREEERDLSLEEYVQKARELVRETRIINDKRKGRFPEEIEKLFVDISAPYSRRLSHLRPFLKLNHQRMCKRMEADLIIAFGMIYTKWKCVLSCPGMNLQLLLPFLTLASFVLFSLSHHKDEYEEENDVKAPESARMEITQLIAEHVKDGWKQYIVDAPSYKRFNNFRGQWTLSRHKLHGQQMWWSLQQVPFDWSVLIWHLATELCIHHPRTSPTTSVELPAARYSRVISNYMIYLLFIRPEMLMPGTRQGLFTAACYDIGLMLKRGNEPPPEDARTVAQQILRTSKSPLIEKIGIMVPGACKVAEELMELQEDKRWKVIQGVWVEMLCCSASSCRGYLHAKSMGEARPAWNGKTTILAKAVTRQLSVTPAGSIRVNGVEVEDKHLPRRRHILEHDMFRGSRETAR
ncbi:hypothetical protein C2845_PM03G06220 [Panicum miliaceum]|uniref:DUF4220 domain-containing protein n=1 Tax=Panicum miliaceum TaxID=4540 RepID=A0A3L6T6G4_PANMI|nr:hypothetical protein C2845_PM03G06220 [Panicum miliaceum]